MGNETKEPGLSMRARVMEDPANKNEPGVVRLLVEQFKDKVEQHGADEVVFGWIHESGDFESFCRRQLAVFGDAASTCFYTVSRSERLGKLTVRLPLPSAVRLIK